MKAKLLPYTTDDEYRISLLDLFGFSEYTDDISQHILDLHTPIKDLPILCKCLEIMEQSCPLCSPETSFLLLFSYDLLPYTHAFLVEYETGSLNALEFLYNKVLEYTI